MKLEAVKNENIKELKRLYYKAFPSVERKPFRIFSYQRRRNKGETLEISIDGKFAGLVITAFINDIVLLDYFAVDENLRGNGIGSEVLSAVKARYNGKRLFLETEAPEDAAPNNDIRKRRLGFYIRNGFVPQKNAVKVYKNHFLIMQCAGEISFDEYKHIIAETNGIFGHFIRPSEII